MQRIPVSSFVGIDGAAGRNGAGNRQDRCIFLFEHKRQRATAALAHDGDQATLAVLIDCETAIPAISLIVGRLNVAAEIGAVYLDFARNGRAIGFCGQRFVKKSVSVALRRLSVRKHWTQGSLYG